MNTAFYLQAILFLGGALLVLRGVGGRKAVLFLSFAVANAVGNVLVGTFHTPTAAAGGGPGWHSWAQSWPSLAAMPPFSSYGARVAGRRIGRCGVRCAMAEPRL